MNAIINMLLARLYMVCLGVIISVVGLVSPALAMQCIKGDRS
jgi:hypothetical protein